MAGVKISALPAATAVAQSDVFAIVQSGTTKKATAAISFRERLLAARTYYVRTDGSNSNTGLVNSSGGAFLTIQYATNVALALDFNGYTVTISVQDGTYSESVTVGEMTGFTGTNYLRYVGNDTTPANVISSSTTYNFYAKPGARIYVSGFSVSGSTNVCFTADVGAVIQLGKINYGAAVWHMFSYNGGLINPQQDYTISGSASIHYLADFGGGIDVDSGITVTLTGTPNFGVYFAYVNTTGHLYVQGITYSGSATGVRYRVTSNGVIDTLGAGASYLPGDSAGSTGTGGQYV